MVEMTIRVEIEFRQLADLVKQVQAGDKVLLTRENKPVARIVPVNQKDFSFGAVLTIRSIKGHKVLTPVISQAELSEEMFGHQ